MAGKETRTDRRRRAANSAPLFLALVSLTSASLLGGLGCRDWAPGDPPVEVRGVVGSEKMPFFEDEEVQEVFEDNGFSVVVEPAGSRQIVESVDWDDYDFVFPSSEPVAASIQQARNIHEVYRPFHTPMVIASFESIATLLASEEALGGDDAADGTREPVVQQEEDGTRTFDVQAFMDLAADDTRWGELNEDIPLGRQSILIRTTDPRDSNSGAMYLALVSHIANSNRVVQNEEQERAVLPTVTDLFLKQGFAAPTSAPPFEAYLSQGIGHTPLLFIYEAQFLEQLLQGDDSLIVLDDDDPNRQMVLLYPSPTVLTTHTLVPFTDDGSEVGRLLVEDEELQELAASHGLRPTRNPQEFLDVVDGRIADRLAVRTEVLDTVQPPAYEVLERLTNALDRAYRNEGVQPPPADEGVG